MSLSTILKEMEVNRPQAEMDISMGSPETYGGRVGLKRAGTEALKRLKLQYRNELMGTTMFIVVTGSGRDAFTELASGETFGCFSTDPNAFYKDLASRINPTLFGRESLMALFNIAGNILEDKAMELDIGSYPMLAFSEKYNTGVNNVDDFTVLIRRAINDQVGPEIVGINSIHAIVDRAIEKKHSATVTPVILNTDDEKFAFDLQKDLRRLTPKVFLVIAGKAVNNLNLVDGAITVKKVTEESVGEALDTIRSKVL
jgi:hypothetical protein